MTVFNIIALIFREQEFFKHWAFLLIHQVVKCINLAQFYPKPHHNEDASLFSKIKGKSEVISGI